MFNVGKLGFGFSVGVQGFLNVNWILYASIWNDNGVWDDSSKWID